MMIDPPSPVYEFERDEEVLGQAAEMDFALQKELYGRIRGCPDDRDVEGLVRGYKALGRSMRLNIALRDKLIRERAREKREAEAEPAPAPATAEAAEPASESPRIRNRKDDLAEALARVIWSEKEHPDFEDRFVRVDEMLEEEVGDDFDAEPLDDHVMALAQAWGLPLDKARAWRKLPLMERDDEDLEPPKPRRRQSSA